MSSMRTMKTSIKKMTLMAAFIALGVSLGYSLISIPNVELVTATIFIAGYLLGVREGILVGVFTEGLYSMFNPYGMAAPPLFIAQIVSMGITGGLGGFLGKQPNLHTIPFHAVLGLAGLISTSIFAILTTLSFVLFTGIPPNKIWGSFVAGIGFYATHIVSNTAIFLLIVPLLLKAIRTIRPDRHPNLQGVRR